MIYDPYKREVVDAVGTLAIALKTSYQIAEELLKNEYEIAAKRILRGHASGTIDGTFEAMPTYKKLIERVLERAGKAEDELYRNAKIKEINDKYYSRRTP